MKFQTSGNADFGVCQYVGNWKFKLKEIVMNTSVSRRLKVAIGIRIVIGVAVMTTVSNCIAQGNSELPSGIVWHGVLTDGLADAKATNRPIMLLSAAPQCAGVPGMW